VAAQPDLASQINTAFDAVAAMLVERHFWYGVGAGAVLVLIVLGIVVGRRYRAKSMTIGMPFGLGSITYESSTEDRVLAWKMYVQLTTRKAALPFDDSHDLIADVYSSLYELFQVTRDLLSGMPLADIGRHKGVADLILRTLNDGLRPHLTRWNAPYRRWWEQQLSDPTQSGKTPREVQQQYLHYKELVEDLKRTNTELSRFADELLAIARSDRPKPVKQRALPTPPSIVRDQGGVQQMGGPSVQLPKAPYDSGTNNTDKTTRQGDVR
jgi:hypothetical protein